MYEAYCVCNDKVRSNTYVLLLISLPYLITSMYGHRSLKNQFNFRFFKSGGSVSIPSQPMVDSRWRKWFCDRLSLQYFQFYLLSIIPTKLHTQLHLRVAVTRRTNGRSLGTFQKVNFFRKWGAWDIKIDILSIFPFLKG